MTIYPKVLNRNTNGICLTENLHDCQEHLFFIRDRQTQLAKRLIINVA